jgi:hypothetical protein
MLFTGYIKANSQCRCGDAISEFARATGHSTILARCRAVRPVEREVNPHGTWTEL